MRAFGSRLWLHAGDIILPWAAQTRSRVIFPVLGAEWHQMERKEPLLSQLSLHGLPHRHSVPLGLCGLGKLLISSDAHFSHL